MCPPRVQTMGSLAVTLFAVSLYLSYEAGNDVERAYFLNCIIEADKFKYRLLNDRNVLNRFVLDTAKLITGRVSFETAINTKVT